MKYPYCLFGTRIDHQPLFKGLEDDPYVADLSHSNPLLDSMDVRDQKRYQTILEAEMHPHYSWGFSGYLERRDSLLRSCEQMVREQRFYHLGVDIIVPFGRPLHAPLDAVVAQSGYEPGEGNYGGFVLLKHENPRFETFYSFYGHLAKQNLPQAGARKMAGEAFASIGDFHENGNWYHHTHLQIITETGLQEGYLSKGYCATGDLARINDLCPCPMVLFKR